MSKNLDRSAAQTRTARIETTPWKQTRHRRAVPPVTAGSAAQNERCVRILTGCTEEVTLDFTRNRPSMGIALLSDDGLPLGGWWLSPARWRVLLSGEAMPPLPGSLPDLTLLRVPGPDDVAMTRILLEIRLLDHPIAVLLAWTEA